MRVSRAAGGFTLIELLVVISIIVLLLSLLTPALDRALYRTELTVCSAQQRTVISGLQLYAFDHARWYPYKKSVHSTSVWCPPDYIYMPGGRISDQNPTGEGRATPAGGGFDYRLIIEGYIDYRKLFLDPMAGKVELGPEANSPEMNVLSSYFHFDGYQFYEGNNYKNQSMGQGMTKVGNRLTWIDRGGPKPVTRKFNVLITDKYHSSRTAFNGHAVMSHPSQLGEGELAVRQDSTPGAGWAVWSGTYTHYNFFNLNTATHGPIDLNYGFQDGSVQQLYVAERPPVFNPYEEHPLTAIPFFNEGDNPNTEITNWILEGN